MHDFYQLNIMTLSSETSDLQQVKHNTQRLMDASEVGDLDAVKRLIPVSDPKSKDSAALRLAARNGHLERVKLLIPVSEPKINSSDSLLWAAFLGVEPYRGQKPAKKKIRKRVTERKFNFVSYTECQKWAYRNC